MVLLFALETGTRAVIGGTKAKNEEQEHFELGVSHAAVMPLLLIELKLGAFLRDSFTSGSGGSWAHYKVVCESNTLLLWKTNRHTELGKTYFCTMA